MSETEREPSSTVFDRWMGQAAENIENWGLQDEQTLLLAIQEEFGELTQAHLEANHEDGDPSRVDDELDDLGALLLQLHERRQKRPVTDGGERPTDDGLYGKYEVRKDGEVVEDCFVLEPESDPAAREALWEYISETDDEELAENLRSWLLATVGATEEADHVE